MIDLPLPRSEELKKLVKSSSEQDIYGVLYENQNQSLSIAEIREILGLESGEQGQLDRRTRNLRKFFIISCVRNKYRLEGWQEQKIDNSAISNRVRALVLRNQRCAQCGRTPSEDFVRLEVDHKLPQTWGGTNDIENLQPLCSDCNSGKRDFYSSYEQYSEQIKSAANYNEPHKRIGELLKAFGGEFVRPDLIEIVANSKQYQDDWQKRLRELRVLGWVIETKKHKENKRHLTYYAVNHFEPWPEGNITSAIRRLEAQRKR